MSEQTAPERLIQAADVLAQVPCRKDEIGGACLCQVAWRTALLLRAIVQEIEDPANTSAEWAFEQTLPAALALADEILGRQP